MPRSDRNRLIWRCALSVPLVVFLYVICFLNVPLHEGDFYGPIITSDTGKLCVAAICGIFLIWVWTFDFGKLVEPTPEDDLDSGSIQTLFEKSQRDRSTPVDPRSDHK